MKFIEECASFRIFPLRMIENSRLPGRRLHRVAGTRVKPAPNSEYTPISELCPIQSDYGNSSLYSCYDMVQGAYVCTYITSTFCAGGIAGSSIIIREVKHCRTGVHYAVVHSLLSFTRCAVPHGHLRILVPIRVKRTVHSIPHIRWSALQIDGQKTIESIPMYVGMPLHNPPSLVLRLLPSFLSHTVQTTGEKPWEWGYNSPPRLLPREGEKPGNEATIPLLPKSKQLYTILTQVQTIAKF